MTFFQIFLQKISGLLTFIWPLLKCSGSTAFWAEKIDRCTYFSNLDLYHTKSQRLVAIFVEMLRIFSKIPTFSTFRPLWWYYTCSWGRVITYVIHLLIHFYVSGSKLVFLFLKKTRCFDFDRQCIKNQDNPNFVTKL